MLTNIYYNSCAIAGFAVYLTHEIYTRDRNQMAFFCLEQAIDANNDVRLIDVFVDKLPLHDFGFKTDYTANGRPAYHPCDLLKLFLYGYLNRIRSSRVLCLQFT